ncbi:hypothetical protein H2O64_20545 [Kordia sp. YSTF-M3]|uniref:DUF4412 domain-containing protein n=1 Tax=Kordia aestuariivivens TaxID=2759037 RepID=A0ABR7QEV7_9FLAO|nr:hypothetical protein [Kordia aestuariivivens]MBC8757074.1 hypothetical protein [Kordia aestuariivivens]
MNVNTKTLVTALITLFIVFSATAQKKMNVDVKPNLIMTYSADGPQGSQVLFALKINEMDAETVKFKYTMSNGDKQFSGNWVMSAEGLESGKYFNWQGLGPGEVRILPKDQTIFSVSKAFFDEIKSKKTAQYDEKTFELKEIPKGKEIKIDGEEVDAIYIVEKDGETQYWILNNRDLPFIINSNGAQGPSFKLSKVGMGK